MRFEGFSPVEILALTKVAGKSTNRDLCDPGEHEIDLVAVVKGEIKIGADHEAKQANAIPWQRIATLLLSRVNETTRRKIVAEAIDHELPGADTIKAQAQAAVDELLDTTIITRKGSVRAELLAENVSGRVTIAAPTIHKVPAGRSRSRGKRSA